MTSRFTPVCASAVTGAVGLAPCTDTIFVTPLCRAVAEATRLINLGPGLVAEALGYFDMASSERVSRRIDRTEQDITAIADTVLDI